MSQRKFLTNTGTDILYRTKSRSKNRKFGLHVGRRWMLGYAYLTEIEGFVRFILADPRRFAKRLRAKQAATLSAQLMEAISGREAYP